MDAIDLEPEWWSRNTGDFDDESLVPPPQRAQHEAHARQQRLALSHQYVVKWREATLTSPLNVRAMIVSCDPFSSLAIANTVIAGHPRSFPLLGTIAVNDNDAHSKDGNDRESLSLYYNESLSLVIALLYIDIDSHAQSLLAQALLAAVTAATITVIDTQPLNSYVNASAGVTASDSDNAVPPLVRILTTTAYDSASVKFDRLTPPMLVHSVSSAVMIECEMSDRSAILFVNYYSPHYVIESYQSLLTLLASLPSLAAIAVADTNTSASIKQWQALRQQLSAKYKARTLVSSDGFVGAGIGQGVTSILAAPDSDLFL